MPEYPQTIKHLICSAMRYGGQSAGRSTKNGQAGKTAARPQLEACLKSLREGDTLVVWRLDRLGRSLTDLVRLIAQCEQRRIQFESLTEKIDPGEAIEDVA
jgi:DNA invertase Pin-like site-specific DNA recombinase